MSIDWNKGPALGEDDWEFYVGDQFLVLVECCDTSTGVKRFPIKNSRQKTYWDAHVLTCTETGWDDANGDSWSAWDWDDVSYWIKLDKNILPALGQN